MPTALISGARGVARVPGQGPGATGGTELQLLGGDVLQLAAPGVDAARVRRGEFAATLMGDGRMLVMPTAPGCAWEAMAWPTDNTITATELYDPRTET